MELHEIIKAIQNGEQVKWKSSKHLVTMDDFGVLFKESRQGYSELLLDDEYDDCFI